MRMQNSCDIAETRKREREGEGEGEGEPFAGKP